MKQRSAFWDNYKGILIFLVVFGHFIYSYEAKSDDYFVEQLYTLIYTFHMPAFVFCSGYFSKSARARSKEAAVKMLLCYIFFNTAMMFFAHFYVGSKLKLLTPYYSYWYIISLICWRMIIGSVEKIRMLIPMSLAITLLVGYWSEFSNILSVRRTVAFFVFFAAGYLLDKAKTEQFLNSRKAREQLLGIIIGLIGIPTVIILIRKLDITSGMTLMGNYKNSEDVLIRLLLLIIASAAIIVLLLIIPNKNIPFLSKFGRNSLLIYLAHRFVTIIFYKGFFPVQTYSRMYVLYALIATFVTCMCFGNDAIAQHFNKGIDYLTDSIFNSEEKTGNLIKTILLVAFVLCLLLRPILN